MNVFTAYCNTEDPVVLVVEDVDGPDAGLAGEGFNPLVPGLLSRFFLVLLPEGISLGTCWICI